MAPSDLERRLVAAGVELVAEAGTDALSLRSRLSVPFVTRS
jgi:hypothetical protein